MNKTRQRGKYLVLPPLCHTSHTPPQYLHYVMAKKNVPCMAMNPGTDIAQGTRKKINKPLSEREKVARWTAKGPDSPFRPQARQAAKTGVFANEDTTTLTLEKTPHDVSFGIAVKKDTMQLVPKAVQQGSPFERAGGAFLQGRYLTHVQGQQVRSVPELDAIANGRPNLVIVLSKVSCALRF